MPALKHVFIVKTGNRASGKSSTIRVHPGGLPSRSVNPSPDERQLVRKDHHAIRGIGAILALPRRVHHIDRIPKKIVKIPLKVVKLDPLGLLDLIFYD